MSLNVSWKLEPPNSSLKKQIQTTLNLKEGTPISGRAKLTGFVSLLTIGYSHWKELGLPVVT